MTPKEYQKPSLALEVKAAKKRLQEITPLWQLQFALPCRESIAVKLRDCRVRLSEPHTHLASH